MRIKTMNSIFVLVTGVILLSGIFVSGVYSSDAFAEKGGNDKQQAKGCINANEKSKVAEQNKHCDGNGNGNGNGGQSIPSNSCGGDSLTADDIEGTSQNDIDNVEAVVAMTGGDTNGNHLIDTLDEWNELQRFIGPKGICLL